MRTLLLLTTLIGSLFSGGNLSGENVNNISAHAYLVEPTLAEQVVWVEEAIVEIEVAPEIVIYEEPVIEEVEEIAEEIVEIKETATYDLTHQKDVGEEEEEVVPPEVSQTWYVEDTATLGLEMILGTYSISDYDYFIISTPSNYIYQYDFYVDSPDGGHANLLGIYQYDATGQRTFFLDSVTGSWE